MSRVVVVKLDCRRCGKGKAAELCVKERLRSFGSEGGAEPQDDAFSLSNAMREVARWRFGDMESAEP